MAYNFKQYVDPPLNEGCMTDQDKLAANTIAMNTIGNHFSKEVSDYLIKLIQIATEV